ncbi:AraC family transcriptional regulator [Algivirga pacifica]|uniref:Helix-turn-helix transcriptional regulator n=1 Tax=Algivirga pacifica TaxID=1162670 RepID=A0ABP9DJ23_9BACT
MKDFIPTYSLDNFNRASSSKKASYQVEVFDANRHFKVQYPHRHDFFEVLFLTQGTGNHIIDDKVYAITPPCIFFLSPGQAHKLELSKDIKGYIFLFTSEFYLLHKTNKNKLLELPFFFNVQHENAPLLISSPNDLSFIQMLFEKGCEQIKQGTDEIEIMNSLLDLLLNYCNHIYPREMKEIASSKGQLLVRKFRQLIEEMYHTNAGIQQYADALNITPNHLTQTVRQVTGRTSSDLIKDKMLLEIKRLLIHTDLTATEIAHQLNYSDQSYFTKFFKKATGVTPTEFRKKSMKST